MQLAPLRGSGFLCISFQAKRPGLLRLFESSGRTLLRPVVLVVTSREHDLCFNFESERHEPTLSSPWGHCHRVQFVTPSCPPKTVEDELEDEGPTLAFLLCCSTSCSILLNAEFPQCQRLRSKPGDVCCGERNLYVLGALSGCRSGD
jgi:hypothetical protein